MRQIFAATLSILLASPCIVGTAWASVDLDRALALIPESATGFVAWPSPKKSNADCIGMLEQLGVGGAMIAGRPIDLFKAQFGIGANFDESAPVIAYFIGKGEAATMVFVIGSTDPAAFMQANMTPAGDAALGRYTSSLGMIVSARAVGNNVIMSPSADAVAGYDASKPMGARFQARLTSEEWSSLDRADLVYWVEADAMDALGKMMRLGSEELPIVGGSNAVTAAANFDSKKILEQLSDAVIAIDIDPLGVWLRTISIAREGSALAALTAARESSTSTKCLRLPGNPFYLAASIDCVGLGGVEALTDSMELMNIDRALLPEWIVSDGAAITSVQFAAYPSKLGVAVGGVLNDSALFIASKNPEGTLARMKASFLALKGEDGGVKRDPQWNDAKTLKSGTIANAFELKETITDMSQMPEGSEYMRLGKQFVVGVRGLVGLAAVKEGGVVVTFSQRPDVFTRAMAAGVAGGDAALASDATLQSIEEWLPPKRDAEIFLGVGRLAMLATSIMSGVGNVFGAEAGAAAPSIPTPDPSMEPLALSLGLGDGRIDGVLVVPTGVLKYFAAMYASRNESPAEAAKDDAEGDADGNSEDSSAQ